MKEQQNSGKRVVTELAFHPEVFVRAPLYSASGYDPMKLSGMLAEAAFRNGLYLASPDFYKVLEDKGFELSLLSAKERLTLLKYYNRAALRPIPFGAFASFGLTKWGAADQMVLGGAGASLLHLLPDAGLTASVNARHAPARLLPNATLYQLGREYRYIKTVRKAGGAHTFSLEGLADTPFYRRFFRFFKKGDQAVREVLTEIGRLSGCGKTEAEDFLDFLLQEEVLISDRQGTLIGADPGLRTTPAVREAMGALRQQQLGLTAPLSGAAAALKSLLPDKLPAAPSLFYAGLERPVGEGALDKRLQDDLLAAVEVLRRLAPDTSGGELAKFKAAFRRRFDRQRVPLLQALDPDGGIPYGGVVADGPRADLLAALRFADTGRDVPQLEWTAVRRFFLRHWLAAQHMPGGGPLLLADGDLAELEGPARPLPAAVAVMFRAGEREILLEHAGGAAAAAIPARFSAFSPAVADFCADLARVEQAAAPEVVFADIGLQVDAHVDNVNRRARIYNYEIPLNTWSALPPENQIRPGDLLLSLQGDELVLESRRLKKRIMPRHASTYNYFKNELGVFRLLCDLQHQGLQSALSFDLEALFPGLAYYPRVQYRSVILSAAKWYIGGKDLERLRSCGDEGAGEGVAGLRKAFFLPRYVLFGAYDQQLAFDLENKEEIRFFAACLKGDGTVLLREHILPGGQLQCDAGRYNGQFLAFVTGGAGVTAGLRAERGAGPQEREFLPGSEWLYLRIFCTPQTADQLLQRVITPAMRRLRGQISGWFFIRYDEDGYQLRLRVRCTPEKTGMILSLIAGKLRSSGLDKMVSEYRSDIYRRELERYGDLIELVESVFMAGSHLAAALISAGMGERRPEGMLEQGMRTADLLVREWLPEVSMQVAFLEEMAGAFMREQGGGKELTQDLDRQYRRLRPAIDGWLGGTAAGWPSGHRTAWRGLLKTLAGLRGAAAALPPAASQSLLADMIHMQLNRLFATEQRRHEMLVYHHLLKFRKSALARQR